MSSEPSPQSIPHVELPVVPSPAAPVPTPKSSTQPTTEPAAVKVSSQSANPAVVSASVAAPVTSTPQDAKGEAEQKPKAKKRELHLNLRFTSHMLNWLLVVVALVALASSLYLGYQALQPGEAATQVVVQPTATPVPKLKLHTSHERYGAPIELPDQIGRDTPF